MRRTAKLLLSCWSLLLAALPAAGQMLWDRTLGTAAYNETSSAFLPVPDGYLNVGKGGGNGTSAALSNTFYLSKVDRAGLVLWQKKEAFPTRNIRVLEQLGAAATATGEIYATGQCTELVSVHPASLYAFGLLVKFSPTGDTLWSCVLHGLTTCAYSRVVATADGGAVVLGSHDTDQFIAKFSTTGKELWHRSYPYSATYPGYLENIAQLSTGGFLVTNSPDYGGVGWKYLLLDSQGLLLATKPARAYGTYYWQLDGAGNVLAGAGRFYKLSAEGDTLWSRQYAQYGRHVEIYLVAPVPGSSNYLLAGTRYNSSDYDLSLLLVDQNGARLRDTVLVRYGGSEYPTGLHVDGQGNYVCGGYSDSGPLGGADQFAFTLHNWNRTLPTRSASAPAPAYQLYPNPATGPDQLHLATPAGTPYVGAYALHDRTGRLVQAGSKWPSQGLPLRGLAPGLYLLHLREGEHWLPALRLTHQ